MSPLIRSHAHSDRNILWLACLVAACLGYYVAVYRLGGAIDAQRDSMGQVAARMQANRTIVAARPHFERTEHELDETLRSFDLYADHATTVARFIRECARITALHQADLVQIDERQIGVAETRAPSGGGASPIELIPLDVTLTGSYRNLLVTIRELAQAPIAMRIEIASIDRTSATDGTGSRGLTARLHVTVERLAQETPLPSTLLLTAEETLHARSN